MMVETMVDISLPSKLNFILLLLVGVMQSSTQIDTQDYCEDETFVAKCRDNEVVVMTQAIYGRMQTGRCISGSSGCSYDVMPIMDEKCSGRKQCSVDIRDLFVAVPSSICDKNLRNYLQAAYTCIKVVVPDTQRCYGNPIQINAASASGFIASYITAETGCGNHDAPWIIRVDPGQKINFTLYDFSTNAPSDEKTCQVLVTIKEATRAASRTVCAGDQRIRKEYTSRANVVEIRRMGINDDPNPERGQFLLKYEAVGCPDLIVNSNTRFRRTQDGQQAELSCTTSDETWKIECKDNKWTGNVANCTTGGAPGQGSGSSAASTSLSLFSLPSGLSVAIVIIIAILIGLVILGVGLVLIRRRRMPRENNPVVEIESHKHEMDYQTSRLPCHYDTAPHGGNALYPSNPMKSDNFGNAYYRTWELQRHGMPPQGGVGAHGQGHYHPHDATSSHYGGDLEHIYESPKSVRREFNNTGEALQYYELDPNSPDNPNPPRKFINT